MKLLYRDVMGDGQYHMIEATIRASAHEPEIMLPCGGRMDLATYIVNEYRVVAATDAEFAALKAILTPNHVPIMTAAQTLRSIPSAARSAASRANGRNGGRPRKVD